MGPYYGIYDTYLFLCLNKGNNDINAIDIDEANKHIHLTKIVENKHFWHFLLLLIFFSFLIIKNIFLDFVYSKDKTIIKEQTRHVFIASCLRTTKTRLIEL
jgi:hypothetical protein